MLDIKGINIKPADSFKKRLIGLMFKKNIDYGLLFKNCHGVHTFFMKEAIDIIVTDKNDEIIKTYKNIKPWKILIFPKDVKNVYELPKGTIK